MTTTSYFLNAKEILVTAAAVTGAITAIIGSTVAIKGLNTWKRQISGQSNHNLSRSLLISAFKYRDAISVLRHPFMPSHEMTLPDKEESKAMSVDAILNYGRIKAYQARWEKVREAHAEVYANLIESEALWGNDLSDIWKSVKSLETTLFVALDDHLRSSRSTTQGVNNRSLPQESYNIIFSKTDDDEFKDKLNQLLRSFESYVREKMKV